MTKNSTQLAVLGSPISHSKSPALHSAAYRVLGLDWEYSAHEVKSGELDGFLSATTSRWRGLSLTMPLKEEIVPLLDKQDSVSIQVGAVNTVRFDSGRRSGYNTDVYGAQRMLREAIPGDLRRALILGGGATARSVAVALAHTGVRELTFAVRSPARSGDLIDLGKKLDVSIAVCDFATDHEGLDVVVSTLPGAADLSASLPSALRSTVPLVDIAYAPWPTAVAQQWLEAGGNVVANGMRMLLYQALAQVRIFVHGNPSIELTGESDVLQAMRAAAFDTP